MRDIVERAMRGDREAFGVLVGQTSDRMYAIASRILRDTHLAEDALQGALVTAWRDLPTLRDPDRFEAWVRKLVVHACYAEARRRNTWAANVRPCRSTDRRVRTRSSPSRIATPSTARSDA